MQMGQYQPAYVILCTIRLKHVHIHMKMKN